jgi:hypothetical protein
MHHRSVMRIPAETGVRRFAIHVVPTVFTGLVPSRRFGMRGRMPKSRDTLLSHVMQAGTKSVSEPRWPCMQAIAASYPVGAHFISPAMANRPRRWTARRESTSRAAARETIDSRRSITPVWLCQRDGQASHGSWSSDCGGSPDGCEPVYCVKSHASPVRSGSWEVTLRLKMTVQTGALRPTASELRC